MKQLFLTLVFLISIVFNSFSQNDDSGNLIYPNNFIISSHAITTTSVTTTSNMQKKILNHTKSILQVKS